MLSGALLARLHATRVYLQPQRGAPVTSASANVPRVARRPPPLLLLRRSVPVRRRLARGARPVPPPVGLPTPAPARVAANLPSAADVVVKQLASSVVLSELQSIPVVGGLTPLAAPIIKPLVGAVVDVAGAIAGAIGGAFGTGPAYTQAQFDLNRTLVAAGDTGLRAPTPRTLRTVAF